MSAAFTPLTAANHSLSSFKYLENVQHTSLVLPGDRADFQYKDVARESMLTVNGLKVITVYLLLDFFYFLVDNSIYKGKGLKSLALPTQSLLCIMK